MSRQADAKEPGGPRYMTANISHGVRPLGVRGDGFKDIAW
jgi:hypothetical protein